MKLENKGTLFCYKPKMDLAATSKFTIPVTLKYLSNIEDCLRVWDFLLLVDMIYLKFSDSYRDIMIYIFLCLEKGGNGVFVVTSLKEAQCGLTLNFEF